MLAAPESPRHAQILRPTSDHLLLCRISSTGPTDAYYLLADLEYGRHGSAACNSTTGTGKACVFHDVTLGDMDVNCRGSVNCYRPSGTNGVLSVSSSSYQPAYAAGSGWDFATGIGTLDVKHLVQSSVWFK